MIAVAERKTDQSAKQAIVTARARHATAQCFTAPSTEYPVDDAREFSEHEVSPRDGLLQGGLRRWAARCYLMGHEPQAETSSMINQVQRTKPKQIRLWALVFVAVLVGIGGTYAVSSDLLDKPAPVAFEATPPVIAAASSNTYRVTPSETFVKIANKVNRTDTGEILPFIVLSSEFEEKFSGKTIEVTISARGSANLVSTYYTAGIGNSGANIFPLKAEFTDVRFTYDVPKRVGEPGEDYLGVAAASDDAMASVDVRSIKIGIQ